LRDSGKVALFSPLGHSEFSQRRMRRGEDILDEKNSEDMSKLASHIVETKSGHFNPDEFEDRYADALKELLKKKQAAEKIEAPKERAPAKVINLMDALRRSVETERSGSAKRPASSVKARAGRRRARSRAAIAMAM
jgi:DNA end-binding protein Ku